MPFRIIEKFHLELGKLVDGSIISIGGEEKKVKINKNLDALDTSRMIKEVPILEAGPSTSKSQAA